MPTKKKVENNKKTTKKASTKPAKTVKKSTSTAKKDVVEKGSLISSLKPQREASGRISFTKTALIVFGIITLVLIGGAFVLGNKVDVRNPFTLSEEDVQTKAEKHMAEDIKALNKKLPKDNQLEEKATYNTKGTVNEYTYYQYIAYTKEMNAYVVWIVNADNADILSVWSSEQHPEDSKTSVAKTAITEIINNLYKDKIPEDTKDKIKDYLKTKENQSVTGKEFAYLQQFTTDKEQLGEGYDYANIYEVDFFTYKPETTSTNNSTTNSNSTSTTTEETDSK